jgi:hypothetical protein
MPDHDDVRRIALALPEVEQGDHPLAFGVRGKGITWVYSARETPKGPRIPHDNVLAVRTDGVGEKETLIAASPDIYFDDDHYRGFPAVLVRLEAIDDAELAEVVTDGWRVQAPKRLVKDWDAARRSPGGDET